MSDFANTRRSSNGPLAILAGGLVRAFEALSIRGAPTLLAFASKVPTIGNVTATADVGGHRITFPAFDQFWCRYLWAGVPYERDVEQIFRKLGKGRALIDCGANIGFWSIRAHDFGFTQVVAVEANRELIPLLSHNLEANGIKGRALHAAIYSSSGENLLLGKTDAHAQGSIGSAGMPVTSITIADIAKDFPAGQEIVAKLDVEGAEVAAMEGAKGVNNVIFIYEDFPKHGMRVTEHVLGQGLAVFGVAPSGETQRITSLDQAFAFNAATATWKGPSNLVACRPEQAPKVERQLA
jgi:FkbM family methyltransferase